MDSFVEAIDAAVRRAKTDPQVRRDFEYYERGHENGHEEGYWEGYDKGCEEVREASIKAIKKNLGMSREEAIKVLSYDDKVDEVPLPALFPTDLSL